MRNFDSENLRWPGGCQPLLPPNSIPDYMAMPLQAETETYLSVLTQRRPAEAVGSEFYPQSFWRDAAEFTIGMFSSVYKPASPVPRWASHVVTDWAVSRAFYRENVQAFLQSVLCHPKHTSYKELYSELLGAIVFWTLDLPASESHHHSYRFGFLNHVLEVALGAFIEMRQTWGDRIFEPEAGDPRLWGHAVVAAALFHDVGKVFDIEVKDPNSGDVWDPIEEPLVLFKYRHKEDLFRPTDFRFRPKRGLHRHEKNGRKLVPLLLPPCASRSLRETFAQAVDAYFSRYDQPPRRFVPPLDQIAEFVHRADQASAAASARNKNRRGDYLSRLFDQVREGPKK